MVSKSKPIREQEKNDAITIGILTTRFKMGQIGKEDLEAMVQDMSKPGKARAAKIVLERIQSMPL